MAIFFNCNFEPFVLQIKAVLTKSGEVGKILTLYRLKSPSPRSKAKFKLPCFFLQVTPFLQIICFMVTS